MGDNVDVRDRGQALNQLPGTLVRITCIPAALLIHDRLEARLDFGRAVGDSGPMGDIGLPQPDAGALLDLISHILVEVIEYTVAVQANAEAAHGIRSPFSSTRNRREECSNLPSRATIPGMARVITYRAEPLATEMIMRP